MKQTKREEALKQELNYALDQLLEYDKEEMVENIITDVFDKIMEAERDRFLEEDASSENKANGYYQRMAKVMTDYFQVKVPRDRLSNFRPVFLDQIEEEENQLRDLAFNLYVKGLSTRDIEDVMDKVYNKKFSSSKVSKITKKFESKRDKWLNRALQEEYYFVYVDTIRIDVRRDTVEKENFYVAIGVTEDFKREILGVYNIPEESASNWEEVFQDFKERGLEKILMVISDELTGIEEVTKKMFPGTYHQFCTTHKKRNILKKVRASDKEEMGADLQELFRAGDNKYTLEGARQEVDDFIQKWSNKYPRIKNQLDQMKLDHYFAFLEFDYKIQRMIHTTNWVERLNKEIRKTEKIRQSLPNPNSALTLVTWKVKEVEENVYQYPVTSFYQAEASIKEKMENLRHN